MRILPSFPLAALVLALGACHNSTEFYVGGDTSHGGSSAPGAASASADHGGHATERYNAPGGIGLALAPDAPHGAAAHGAAAHGAPHGGPQGDHAAPGGDSGDPWLPRLAPALGTDGRRH